MTNYEMACELRRIAKFIGSHSSQLMKNEAKNLYAMADDIYYLDGRTKEELESIGREHGIELDRRKKRETMVEDLKAHLNG